MNACSHSKTVHIFMCFLIQLCPVDVESFLTLDVLLKSCLERIWPLKV